MKTLGMQKVSGQIEKDKAGAQSRGAGLALDTGVQRGEHLPRSWSSSHSPKFVFPLKLTNVDLRHLPLVCRLFFFIHCLSSNLFLASDDSHPKKRQSKQRKNPKKGPKGKQTPGLRPPPALKGEKFSFSGTKKASNSEQESDEEHERARADQIASEKALELRQLEGHSLPEDTSPPPDFS
jgi:hypothetical protein